MTGSSDTADVIPLPVDGRTARRQRGRNAVIDAVVDLLHEGHVPPTTAQVTRRAGVSEATLFRYFDTLDDLQLAATRRFLDTHAHLFVIPGAGEGSLVARIDRFVAARSALWEAIAPITRLGRARAYDHAGMEELLSRSRRSQVDQLAEMFSPELTTLTPARRQDAVAVAASVTSFEAWELHHRDLDRTPAQIRRAWRAALEALLDPRSPGGPS